MPSLVLCYAPEDEAFARRLGGYLEANLPFQAVYGEGVVREDFDLVDAAERGLSAEAALVLLSAHSVPKVWTREKWEPVFFSQPEEFGGRLGFVQIEACKFPALLCRQHFFDAREDWLKEARRIRRWLLRPEQSLEREGAAEGPLLGILDAPGAAADISYTDAVAFAGACERDFEAVYILDCEGRSAAGILGDAGQAQGLRLAGTVQENRETLRARCERRRDLFVFAGTTPEARSLLAWGGRASVIFTRDAPARRRAEVDEIAAVFLAVPRDDLACTGLLGDAVTRMTECLAGDFELGLRLGWAILGVLRAGERFAEAVELLDAMAQAARDRDDALALYRIEWEQSWLRDSSESGEALCILPTAGPEVAQLSLFG